MSKIKNPIICALDTKNTNDAIKTASDLKDGVGIIKLGLEFFVSNGPQAIRKMSELNIPIFLDLKLHDIPNTVAESMKGLVDLGVNMTTIHSSGGYEMMRKCVEGASAQADKIGAQKPIILGVTILTSIDNNSLNDIGFKGDSNDCVIRLASLAQKSGLDGIVCSAHEVARVKQELGNDFITVVPGIRPPSFNHDDQKRIMTPKQAVDNGADYLVIGRPITKSADPISVCNEILYQIS